MVNKNLFLLRHAKSDLNPDFDDKDRILSPKGVKESELVGQYLNKLDSQPEYIICSSAKRTLQTCQIIEKLLKKMPENYITDDLYNASLEEIIKIITDIPDNFQNVMLIGHNPGIHNIATYLSSPSKESVYLKLLQSYPTGTLSILNFNIVSWNKASYQSGILIDLTPPKILTN